MVLATMRRMRSVLRGTLSIGELADFVERGTATFGVGPSDDASEGPKWGERLEDSAELKAAKAKTAGKKVTSVVVCRASPVASSFPVPRPTRRVRAGGRTYPTRRLRTARAVRFCRAQSGC